MRQTRSRARAVQFRHYGDIDVLEVVEVDEPVPGPDQVLVAVRAAGVNPGEAAIRSGRLDHIWPATFPSGQGSDLAGTVRALGERAHGFAVGDEVLGFTDDRASHADYVVADQDHLVRKPAGVGWPEAGALKVAGTTAWASVGAVDVHEGDMVVVSAAAGGVGILTSQLARLRGARVIGLASEPHHAWLDEHGIVPVDYRRPDLAAAVRAAHGHVDAFLDTFGNGYVDLALELGVPPGRVNTIADFPAAEKHGVHAVGGSTASTAEVLAALAELLGTGRLELPIAATYPLARVRDAYRELERRHTRGKIVLIP
ncbi:NADP-dependent oxidoreductase [Nonomuraea sp. MTCD27]|uniref:NADP-dependent oxidoreductase n=1 Tax=Nonomuraea sp. MTCD27 TaxID=1676747 RepID=UPI0035C0A228